MEGFIFTNKSVISDFKMFAKQNKPDFVGAGFEKRYFPLNKFIKSFSQSNDNMDLLHNKSINEMLTFFLMILILQKFLINTNLIQLKILMDIRNIIFQINI